MAYADLDEIHNFVQHSLKTLKDNKADCRNKPDDFADLPNEPWVSPVVCNESPVFKVKKARSTDTHQQIEVLDIVRAFCHPRVIETVSQILQDEFKT